MANIKISELEELERVDNDDLLVIVDTSANETKKVKARNVGTGGGGSDVVIISDTQPTSEDNKIWIDTGEVQNLGSEVHIGDTINSKIGLNILYSKNLCDISKVQIGKQWNGGSDANTATVFVPVKPSTTYTISFGNGTFSDYYLIEKNSESDTTAVVSATAITSPTTRTTNASTYCLAIIFYKSGSAITQSDFNNFTIQVEKNGTQTSYKPYVPPTINVYGEDIYVKPTIVTGNGWTMIKYENGIMIGYKTQSFSAIINNAWGSLYSSANLNFDAYPVEFTSVPVANILQTENSSCFVMNWDSSVNTKSQLGGFRAVRPDTSSQTRNFGLSAIVIGRWK